MWAVSAAAMAGCARAVRRTRDDRLVPLMGVMGAFIFTAQMINFTIPGTGSSGHLGGGLLLAVLLGPAAAFLVTASVLTVQALFFADGGLLALGCNMFNLGVIPALVVYPLVYRAVAGRDRVGTRAWFAALAAGIVALQAGAFGVVVETRLSGISELPFRTFVLLMQPIHLAIGMVEGLVTAVVVAFIARARPDALMADTVTAGRGSTLRPVWIGFLAAAAILGGIVSWMASAHPDGLEWAVEKITSRTAVEATNDGVHAGLAGVQKKTAMLPDYGFKGGGGGRAVTSYAGLLGGTITLGIIVLAGWAFGRRKR